ncbi:MAG: SdpI family protein [Bacteroidota bacterium]
MMENPLVIILIHAISILPILGIFWYLKKFPPKEINSWYGYRTPSAMRNQDTWQEANTFSANLIFKAMLLSLIVSVLSIFLFKGEISILISTIFMVAALFGGIIATEIRLKKLFNKDGTRKEKAL